MRHTISTLCRRCQPTSDSTDAALDENVLDWLSRLPCDAIQAIVIVSASSGGDW